MPFIADYTVTSGPIRNCHKIRLQKNTMNIHKDTIETGGILCVRTRPNLMKNFSYIFYKNAII
jgi:hypothetical protein